jgi:hypothetical protein
MTLLVMTDPWDEKKMKFKSNHLKSVFMLFLVSLFFLISFQHSYGAFYKYFDRDGKECYTDNRDSIPAEFRKKAVKINRYEEQEAGARFKGRTEKQTETVADKEEEKTGIKDLVAEFFRKIADNRLYKAGIALGVAIMAFIVVKKIGESVGSKSLSILLRIAFTLALLLYLYDLFSKEMVNTYEGIRETTTSVKKLKESRDRKLNETVNELFPEQKKEQ